MYNVQAVAHSDRLTENLLSLEFMEHFSSFELIVLVFRLALYATCPPPNSQTKLALTIAEHLEAKEPDISLRSVCGNKVERRVNIELNICQVARNTTPNQH